MSRRTPGREERRVAPRRAANGEVRLEPGMMGGSVLVGRLVDVSDSGFRCRHDCVSLSSGETVRFSFARREGEARVVWTRILEGAVESGFAVITEKAKQ